MKKGGVLWVYRRSPNVPTRHRSTPPWMILATRLASCHRARLRTSTHVLRRGAQQLLAQAVEAEVADRIDRRQDCRDSDGLRQVVRNGHLPQRTLTTGLGPVAVQQPRVDDRRPAERREKFSSTYSSPPYPRKTKSIEELIPWLYLKGVSSGDFSEALAALLGPQAKGLSVTTVTRLKSIWEKEYHEWSRRRLAGKQYVYVLARRGMIFNIRLEGGRQCILVLRGATADGKKELIAIQDGQRESEQSWKELLLDVQVRRAVGRAEAGDRRRGVGVLESVAANLAGDGRAALLGA